MFKNLRMKNAEYDQESTAIIEYRSEADTPIYETLKEICLHYPNESIRSTVVTHHRDYEFNIEPDKSISIFHYKCDWLPVMTVKPDDTITIMNSAANVEKGAIDVEEIVKLYKLNEKLCQSLATKADTPKPKRLKI